MQVWSVFHNNALQASLKAKCDLHAESLSCWLQCHKRDAGQQDNGPPTVLPPQWKSDEFQECWNRACEVRLRNIASASEPRCSYSPLHTQEQCRVYKTDGRKMSLLESRTRSLCSLNCKRQVTKSQKFWNFMLTVENDGAVCDETAVAIPALVQPLRNWRFCKRPRCVGETLRRAPMVQRERRSVLAVFAAYDEVYSCPGAARWSVAADIDEPSVHIVSVTAAAPRSDHALDLHVIRRKIRAVSSRCETDCGKENEIKHDRHHPRISQSPRTFSLIKHRCSAPKSACAIHVIKKTWPSATALLRLRQPCSSWS